MHVYRIVGRDAETGAAAELNAEAPSIPDAVTFARSRGLEPTMIYNARGEAHRPNDAGVFVREGSGATSARAAAEKDWAMVIAILIPILGLLIGAVRLGKRDQSGARIIVASLIAGAVWFATTTALTSCEGA